MTQIKRFQRLNEHKNKVLNTDGKYYILPLIFTKRLCDVFDDELNRIADHTDLMKNNYNISPSRYIQTRLRDRP